jgi:hypothetical protein
LLFTASENSVISALSVPPPRVLRCIILLRIHAAVVSWTKASCWSCRGRLARSFASVPGGACASASRRLAALRWYFPAPQVWSGAHTVSVLSVQAFWTTLVALLHAVHVLQVNFRASFWYLPGPQYLQ